jgi:hypothetical protein
MVERVRNAQAEIQRLKQQLQDAKAVFRERQDLIRNGGERKLGGRSEAFEGRKVGIDFFQSPRGPPGPFLPPFPYSRSVPAMGERPASAAGHVPPQHATERALHPLSGDLRLVRDQLPGKHGLAGEYAGNREKDNPWEWDCEWQEMVRRPC